MRTRTDWSVGIQHQQGPRRQVVPYLDCTGNKGIPVHLGKEGVGHDFAGTGATAAESNVLVRKQVLNQVAAVGAHAVVHLQRAFCVPYDGVIDFALVAAFVCKW